MDYRRFNNHQKLSRVKSFLWESTPGKIKLDALGLFYVPVILFVCSNNVTSFVSVTRTCTNRLVGNWTRPGGLVCQIT